MAAARGNFGHVICLIVVFYSSSLSVSSQYLREKYVKVRPGEAATLECDVTYPVVQWTGPRDNLIEPDEKKFIYNRTAGTLNITHVGDANIGIYHCRNNLTVHNRIHLESSPHVLRMQKSINYVVGETAVITCTAWGYPTPTISWYKTSDKHGKLEEQLFNSTSVTIRSVANTNAHHVTEELSIANLTYNDYAYYHCVAHNGIAVGNHSNVMFVRVKDKLAPLWPFIGICVEIVVLVTIIVVYEKRKSKQIEEDEAKEKADFQTNANDHKGDESVRFRK